jgi:flagella basal body P-ring formation protein FlgA
LKITQFAVCLAALLTAVSVYAAATPAARGVSPVAERVRAALARNYPGARVELTGEIHWAEGSGEPSEKAEITIVSETARAEAVFRAGQADGWVSFAAYMPAWVAVRRVLPSERLSADRFVQQEINVAQGMPHEYRGVILPIGTDLAQLESRQTILEGQFATSTAVVRVPDVRRGESVRVHLVAGDITLSTSGVAQEPAYLDGSVRITASKSKKELSGRLTGPGLVEVKL